MTAIRELQPQAAQWRAGLTAREGMAVHHYQDDSGPMNFALRQPGLFGGNPRVNQDVADLDSAIDKGALANDTVLYRGMRLSGKLPVGQSAQDPAFASTSVDRDFAHSWATSQMASGNHNQDRPALFEIQAKAGQKAGLMGNDKTYNESEVVLPRNTTQTITGHRTETVSILNISGPSRGEPLRVDVEMDIYTVALG